MKTIFNLIKLLIIGGLYLGKLALKLFGKNKKQSVSFECLRETQSQDDKQRFTQINSNQQQHNTQNNQNLEIENQEISYINQHQSNHNDNNQEDFQNFPENQEQDVDQKQTNIKEKDQKNENDVQQQSIEQVIPKEENTDNNQKQNSAQENKEITLEPQQKEITQQDSTENNLASTQKNEQLEANDENTEVSQFKEQQQQQSIEQIEIQQEKYQEKQQSEQQDDSTQINEQSSAIEQNNEINKENNDQQQQQPIEQENNYEKQQNKESEQQDDSTQINEQSSAIEQNNEINKTIDEDNEQQQQQPILEQENNQDQKQNNNDKLQETINLLNKIFDESYRWRGVDAQFKNFVSEQMSQTELINYYFPSRKNQYKKQIQGIKQELIGYRRIRGDGNCFYTAFAFQYFQILLTDKQRREQFEYKISTLKVSINYKQIQIENNEDIPKLFLNEFRKINDEKELLNQISDPDKLFYGLSIIVLRNYIVELYQNNEEIRNLGNNFIVPEILEWEKECNTNELIINLLAKELKLIIIVHFFDLKNNTYKKTQYGKEDLPQIILLLAPGHYQVGILKK